MNNLYRDYRLCSKRNGNMSGYYNMFEIQAKLQFFTDEETLKKEWRHKAKNNIKQTTFLEGILLKSLDPENPHPFVDYAVFCSRPGGAGGVNHTVENHIPRSPNSPLPKNSRQRNHSGRLNHFNSSIQNGPLIKPPQQEQGLYDELEYIIRDDVKALPRTPVSKDSVYFLSAFRTDGHVDTLEKTWKTWSGADYMLWKCPLTLNLRRITFLKATYPPDPFTFVVMCECEEGVNFCHTAKEFLDRLKDRRCGLVGLYKVERYYIESKTKR